MARLEMRDNETMIITGYNVKNLVLNSTECGITLVTMGKI